MSLADTVSLSPRHASLLSLLACVPQGEHGLDPVRIVKGLFVASQELPESILPADARYTFIAYDYGPFSKDIYNDLDWLSLVGLVDTAPVPGRRWRRYSLSDAGRARMDEVRAKLPESAVDYLAAIYGWVSRLSFADLLKTVYERYPKYAKNSIFEEPRG